MHWICKFQKDVSINRFQYLVWQDTPDGFQEACEMRDAVMLLAETSLQNSSWGRKEYNSGSSFRYLSYKFNSQVTAWSVSVDGFSLKLLELLIHSKTWMYVSSFCSPCLTIVVWSSVPIHTRGRNSNTLLKVFKFKSEDKISQFGSFKAKSASKALVLLQLIRLSILV